MTYTKAAGWRRDARVKLTTGRAQWPTLVTRGRCWPYW
jgi:hypothetical protein